MSSMVTAVNEDGAIVGRAGWLKKKKKLEGATWAETAGTNAKEAPSSLKSADKSAPAAGPDATDRHTDSSRRSPDAK
ncbi:hypothetical protein N7486_004927 [Penicillium sp. IBT 16267x]|nr:hypothetical protein N7486_004927 [Penicillium sp. IBT 16267x]